MDDEIQYLEELIAIKTRRLRIITKQVATTGEAYSPPDKLMEIEDLTKEISELEQKKQIKTNDAGNGDFIGSEQLAKIAGKVAEIAGLEKEISIQEGTVKILKEVFYPEHQSLKIKAFIVGTIIVAMYPIVRVIIDTFTMSEWGYYERIGLGIVTILILVWAVYVIYRKLIELYENVGGLEQSLHAKKEKLLLSKTELAKIYRVSD